MTVIVKVSLKLLNLPDTRSLTLLASTVFITTVFVSPWFKLTVRPYSSDLCAEVKSVAADHELNLKLI